MENLHHDDNIKIHNRILTMDAKRDGSLQFASSSSSSSLSWNPFQSIPKFVGEFDTLHIIGWTLNKEMTCTVIHVLKELSLLCNQQEQYHDKNYPIPPSLHFILDDVTQDEHFCQILKVATRTVHRLTLKNNSACRFSHKRLLTPQASQVLCQSLSFLSQRQEQSENNATAVTLQHLTISGMDLDKSAIQALSTLLKQQPPLKIQQEQQGEKLSISSFIPSSSSSPSFNFTILQSLILADNWWIGAMEDGAADYCATMLANGLAKNGSLKEFQLHSTPDSFRDDHLARILWKGFQHHPTIETLKVDDRIWHFATLEAIGKLLHNKASTSSKQQQRQKQEPKKNKNGDYKKYTAITTTNTATRRSNKTDPFPLTATTTATPTLSTTNDNNHSLSTCQLKHVVLNRQHSVRRRTSPTPYLDLSSLLDGIKRNNGSLQTIALCQCHLQNEQFQNLFHSIAHCSSIIELDVSQNRITSLKMTTNNTSNNNEYTDDNDRNHHGRPDKPTVPTTSLRRLNLTGNPASPTLYYHKEALLAFGRRTMGFRTPDEWSQREEQRNQECQYLSDILQSNPFLYNLGNNNNDDLIESSVLFTPYNQHLLDMNRLGRVLIESSITIYNLHIQQQQQQHQNQKKEVPLSLWPTILEKVNRTDNFSENELARSANVVYHLLRGHFCQGPSLFEK